ncbi:Uncharacterized protein TCM_012160 [Theobroma cacao]|uniref:Uncharacterized protein n=1 Tax=Theobroma cacao TaxID=3641 RepID=A0A061FUR9_THECC|nr:Uncharacterized protein TCM_012160 [Theobroma cacao]
MGAKGSRTPLHADVFRSCIWSANVFGKKKWLFLAHLQCHLLFDRLPGWNAYSNRIKLSLCLADGIIKSIICGIYC